MDTYLLGLIQRYKSKGILVDTNIFLLYLTGSLDTRLIGKSSRTAKFSEDDFKRVSRFIDFFDVKIIVPDVLTEVSDLIGNSEELQAALKAFIEKSQEIFINSVELSEKDSFLNFGLADTSVTYSAKDNYLIFTDDRPLYGFPINSGIEAVNLDQVRMI